MLKQRIITALILLPIALCGFSCSKAPVLLYSSGWS